MHNDDTTLVIVENDNSDVLAISHADVLEDLVRNEKLSLTSAPQTLEKAATSNENQILEKEEAADNFVVVQNNEKDFINEFLTEYHRCLQKKFPKQMGKLKYKWTQKAVEETLYLLFEKYSVTKK